MVQCGACGKFIAATGGAACSTCNTKYHKACLNINEKATIRKDWVCPCCKLGQRKGDNTNTPAKSICDAPTPNNASPACVDISTDDNNDKEERRYREMVVFMGEMRQFRAEMNELRESLTARMADIERRQDALEQREAARMNGLEGRLDALEQKEEARMDGLESRLGALEQKEVARTDGLESRLDALEQQEAARTDGLESRLDALEQREAATESPTADLEKAIKELKLELNDRDQEALLSDFEIGLLKEEKGVSVVQSVTMLAARLGVTLEARDVVFAERVGLPPEENGGKPRRVVVRLARRHLRDELLVAARKRPAPGSGLAGDRVFLNERLTRLNRQLFHRVREECGRLEWSYSWTRRGRVFARQADKLPVHIFRSFEDIDRVFGVQNKD